MKKCAKCEKDLEEEYRFCPFCGYTTDNFPSQKNDSKKEEEQEEFMIGFGLAFQAPKTSIIVIF